MNAMDKWFHPMVPRYNRYVPQTPGYGYPPESPSMHPGPPGMPSGSYQYPFPANPQEMAPPSPDEPLFGEFKNPFKGLFKKRPREYRLSQQLYRVLGQQVQVSTFTGVLNGNIDGVYPEHLLISKGDQKYYIRWDAVVFVAPVEEE